MSTLWLLRHAHPVIDAGVCYGRLDVAADAARTAQAAKDFSGLLPAGSVLRHSPLQRCMQLANALAAVQPDLVPDLHCDPRLQEMDFGRWEGLRWAQIPRPDIDAWATDLATYAPGGGESLTAMLRRVQQALQHSWGHDSGKDQRDVVWVTHAGVIRCVQWLQQHGNEQPTSTAWNLPAPGYGQWLALRWGGLAGMLQHP